MYVARRFFRGILSTRLGMREDGQKILNVIYETFFLSLRLVLEVDSEKVVQRVLMRDDTQPSLETSLSDAFAKAKVDFFFL